MCNYLLIRHQDMRLMTDISFPLEWIQHFWANCQISVIKFVSVFKCNSDFKLKAPVVIISLPCVPWLNTTAWSQISARSNSTRAQMFSVGLSVTITPQGQKFLNNLAGEVLSHLLGLNNSTPFFFKERCAPLAPLQYAAFCNSSAEGKMCHRSAGSGCYLESSSADYHTVAGCRSPPQRTRSCAFILSSVRLWWVPRLFPQP